MAVKVYGNEMVCSCRANHNDVITIKRVEDGVTLELKWSFLDKLNPPCELPPVVRLDQQQTSQLSSLLRAQHDIAYQIKGDGFTIGCEYSTSKLFELAIDVAGIDYDVFGNFIRLSADEITKISKTLRGWLADSADSKTDLRPIFGLGR